MASNNLLRLFLYPKSAILDAQATILTCGYQFASLEKIPVECLEIVQEAHGKPDFSHTLHFSLSHSKDYWLCGVSCVPLGVDLEKIRDCNKESIAKRFFHETEYAMLKKQQFTGFFDTWCAKESYVKYTGEGITEHFSRFQAVDGMIIQNGCTVAQYQKVALLEGYACIVCTQKPVTIALDRN